MGLKIENRENELLGILVGRDFGLVPVDEFHHVCRPHGLVAWPANRSEIVKRVRAAPSHRYDVAGLERLLRDRAAATKARARALVLAKRRVPQGKPDGRGNPPAPRGLLRLFFDLHGFAAPAVLGPLALVAKRRVAHGALVGGLHRVRILFLIASSF